MWIYQNKQWPTLSWRDKDLSASLSDIRHRQGLLIGRMNTLGFSLKQEASLTIISKDILKTSEIEGENLNQQEVRSSVARRLGLDVAGLIPSGRHVDGVVEMLLDATQNYKEPLTKERLFSWHAALFPTGQSGLKKITVGAWRKPNTDPMQVVSGPTGKEKVHYEAPQASTLDKEMDQFLEWFESDTDNIDPVLKAGVAHLWFVTIHPFEDGNGRIARAIADLMLARSDKTNYRFYSMSTQIRHERKDYYKKLEQQQRSTTDITPWLDWFLSCLGRSIEGAEGILETVLYKDNLWGRINHKPVNERQQLIINRMLEDFKGHMNTSKYAKLTKSSNDTALRDIKDLLTRHIFIQNEGGGRSTSYRLPMLNEIEKID